MMGGHKLGTAVSFILKSHSIIDSPLVSRDRTPFLLYLLPALIPVIFSYLKIHKAFLCLCILSEGNFSFALLPKVHKSALGTSALNFLFYLGF